MTTTPQVRRASLPDAESIVRLLTDRFHNDPVSCWIFPDEHDRRTRHPHFLRPFVQLALKKGQVDIAGEHDGVALWLDVLDTPPDPDVATLQAACGPNWVRAEHLFTMLETRHPTTPHAYLPFIAARQGHGFGTALLMHRAVELDRTGRASYLEASSPRNARLYRRLGYQDHGEPAHLPDGPAVLPMWRSPR